MPQLANLFADGRPRQTPFVDVTAAEARAGCTFNIELPRQARCAHCGGIGEASDGAPCEPCAGEGLVQERELVTITVPPDTPVGTVLTLRGEGDDHRDPAQGRRDLAVGVRIDGVSHPPERALPARQDAPVPWLHIALAVGALAAVALLAWLRVQS